MVGQSGYKSIFYCDLARLMCQSLSCWISLLKSNNTSRIETVLIKDIQILMISPQRQFLFSRILCLQKDVAAGEVNKTKDTRVSMPRTARPWRRGH